MHAPVGSPHARIRAHVEGCWELRRWSNIKTTLLHHLCPLQSVSPQVRALKSGTPAAGAAAGSGSSAAAGARPPLTKMARRQIIASFTLLMLALYFGFGLWGPSGAATAACLIAFAFLSLP